MTYKQIGLSLALNKDDDRASRTALNVKVGPASALHSPLEKMNAAMAVLNDVNRGGCVVTLAESRRWS